MIPTSCIELINWRIFDHAIFRVPNESTIIVDKNGSGKTSYLASLYSLLTGQSWPPLKFGDMLRSREPYFAVRTHESDWFISAKTSSSGSVVTRFSVADDVLLPRVALYQPDDNRWLFIDRQTKMDILDRMVMSVVGSGYAHDLKMLTSAVRNKQRLLRRYIENGYDDEVLARTYTRDIERASERIRAARLGFLLVIEQKMEQYVSWLERDLDITISYAITDTWGKRVYSRVSNGCFDNSIDFDGVWKAEQRAGKILYGAQRDDMILLWHQRPLQSILSRGEMRLFVLFAKYIATQLAKSQTLVWLLDDVFNEFDGEREQTLFHHVLLQSDGFIATSTHHTSLPSPHVSLASLQLRSTTFSENLQHELPQDF